MPRRRSSHSTGLFLAVVLLLAAACAFLLLRAESLDRQARYLASLTPTPSAVPRKVSYIYDSQTPSPTRLHMGVGAMGQTVYDVQARLRDLGYYPYDPDAKFGTGTRDAVLRFQADNGLAQDGIVGEETLSALMSPAAKPCPTAAPN